MVKSRSNRGLSNSCPLKRQLTIQPGAGRSSPRRRAVPAATIVLLGRPELRVGGHPAGLRRQLRQALALMAAARGRRVRREEIAAAVWDDEDRDVRTLMWSLRKALREGGGWFDLPADKGREGSYRLLATGTDSLEESVDAFRFL